MVVSFCRVRNQHPFHLRTSLINNLTDFHHIDLLAHFDRERIPGAHSHNGVAEDLLMSWVTQSVSYTLRVPVHTVTSRSLTISLTSLAPRYSRRWATRRGRRYVFPQSVASPALQTLPAIPEVRNVLSHCCTSLSQHLAGFAIKIKTDEGNLDWVFNNTPVFFIRDPAKFPHFIHTQKRDPQTHLKDADMFWVCGTPIRPVERVLTLQRRTTCRKTRSRSTRL